MPRNSYRAGARPCSRWWPRRVSREFPHRRSRLESVPPPAPRERVAGCAAQSDPGPRARYGNPRRRSRRSRAWNRCRIASSSADSRSASRWWYRTSEHRVRRASRPSTGRMARGSCSRRRRPTPPAASPAAIMRERRGDGIEPGAAQTVESRARHVRRKTCKQRAHAGDISIVLAGLIGAAENDIVHCSCDRVRRFAS